MKSQIKFSLNADPREFTIVTEIDIYRMEKQVANSRQ